MSYHSCREQFFNRQDPEDIRLGSLAIDCSAHSAKDKSAVAILGTPDDEGIQKNGGRIGSALAPEQIRTFFYKMTPPSLHGDCPIHDYGNLPTQGKSLDEKHQLTSAWIQEQTRKDQFWIRWGGGHDYGFADGSGFLSATVPNKQSRPLIINFDAHLDVRPLKNGPNSGTPFRQLLEKFPQSFDLWEVGLQPQCNSRHHWQWATEQKAVIIPLETISQRGLLVTLEESLEKDLNRPVYLSIDIDCFNSSEAPGCSQSWPTGLTIKDFLPAMNWLMQSFSVKGLGVYEVSPPLDQDNRTSKLAALISYHGLFDHLRIKS